MARASFIELVNKVAKDTNTTQWEAKEFTKKLFAAIRDTEGTLTVPDFGTFKLKTRKARTARNPHDGTPVPVPARVELTFKEVK